MKRKHSWSALSPFSIAALVATVLVTLCHAPMSSAQNQPASAAQTQPAPDNQPAAQPQPPQPQPQPNEQERLPKYGDLQTPSAEELLTKPPVDWIVLNTDEVLVVQPVYPRPDTLAKMKQERDKLDALPSPTSVAEREERKEKRAQLHYLNITLPSGSDDENPEYQLHERYIKNIVYHEELLLRRIDVLIKERDLRKAFDMLFTLERRLPDWPGVQDRRNSILFAEAEDVIEAGRLEEALVRLEELHTRDPQFRGLQERLGEVADRLIAAAAKAEDFHRAHHFLDRLRLREPAHPVAQKWRRDFQTQASAFLDQARAASERGDHAAATYLTERSLRAWQLTGAADRDAQRRILHRFQRLKVGVLRLPGEPAAYPFATDADRRRVRLTQAQLFAVDHIDETPHYRTRFFEEWKPTDLGRETVFALRQNRQYWESTPLLTSTEVVDTLAARMNPAGPEYDERFASYVDSLVVSSPYEFTVQFGRVPLRIEALFTVPVLARAPRANGPAADGDAAAGKPRLLSSRFRVEQQTNDRIIYRRELPEPDGMREYHVAEVAEMKYESEERLLQGLFREEIDVLPQLRHWDVPLFADDEQFTVGSYALPVSHVLQFNPKSPALENRQLRGALQFAINRQKILEETVLKQPGSPHGRIVTAPWPKSSYAYNTLIQPREYDLNAAFSLALAAGKQFEGDSVPPLKLICPPDDVVEEAARKLIEAWDLVGIKVELITDPQAAASESGWDLVYRTVQMEEPLIELWPFLTFDDRARVGTLAHLPDWLRQELLALDNAGDWNSAIRILHRLHQQLWSEIQFIPLWEVDEFYVIRKNVVRPRRSSAQAAPMHIYQAVEEWIVR